MEVKSVNLAEPREIVWKGRTQVTGIYKYPVSEATLLTPEGVKGDLIGNKKVHGGAFKACYLFSSEHYDHWKTRYPELEWHWGMFGENLTTHGLLDDAIYVGDIFQIGFAKVQATIPREPCYKLGLKFGDQSIISSFIDYGHPGSYGKVIEEGVVTAGSGITRLEAAQNSISMRDFFIFLNSREKDQDMLRALLENPYVPDYKKDKLKRYIK